MLKIHVTENDSLFSVKRKAKRISKMGEAVIRFSNLPVVMEDSPSQGKLFYLMFLNLLISNLY